MCTLFFFDFYFSDSCLLNARWLSPAFSGLRFRLSARPSFRPHIEVGTLWSQLLLQFYTDSFETSMVFLVMSFGYNPQNTFCHVFHKLNLAIFWALSVTK